VVAIKIGRSDKARVATMTHTASLAGSAAAGSALLRRLGIIEVETIAVFLETLKLLHAVGPLPGASIASVSCSGGEASLMADLSNTHATRFRRFRKSQRAALKAELGPIVTIANPLDYHTFIWGDTERMTRVFSTVMEQTFDLTVFILDLPRADRCDPSSYQCAVDAIIAAKARTGARVAVLASLSRKHVGRFHQRFHGGRRRGAAWHGGRHSGDRGRNPPPGACSHRPAASAAGPDRQDSNAERSRLETGAVRIRAAAFRDRSRPRPLTNCLRRRSTDIPGGSQRRRAWRTRVRPVW
jgi:hypothetical protein